MFASISNSNNNLSGNQSVDLLMTIHEDIAQLKRSVHELQSNYVDIKTVIVQEVNTVLKERLEELTETFAKEIKKSLRNNAEQINCSKPESAPATVEPEKRVSQSQELLLPNNSNSPIKASPIIPSPNAKIINPNVNAQPVLIKPILVKPSLPQPVPILHLNHGKISNVPLEVKDSFTDPQQTKVIKVILNTKTKDNQSKSEIVSIVEEKPNDYSSVTVEPNRLPHKNPAKRKQKSTKSKQSSEELKPTWEFEKQANTSTTDHLFHNILPTIVQPSFIFNEINSEPINFQHCEQIDRITDSPLPFVQENISEYTINSEISHENSFQDHQVPLMKKCQEVELSFNLNGHILSEVQNLTIPIHTTVDKDQSHDEIISVIETIDDEQLQSLSDSLNQVYQTPSTIFMCQGKPEEIFNPNDCIPPEFQSEVEVEMEGVVNSSHEKQILVNFIPALNPTNANILDSYTIELQSQENEQSATPTNLQECRRDMDKILDACNFSQFDDDNNDSPLTPGTPEDNYEQMSRIHRCNGLIFNPVSEDSLTQVDEDSMERLEEEAEEMLQAEAEVKKRIETLCKLDPLPTPPEPPPKVKEYVDDQPKLNECVDDQPKAQECVDDQPKVQECFDDQQKVQECVDDQPKVKECVDDQPKVTEWVDDQPKVREFVDDQPKVKEFVDDQQKVKECVDDQQKVKECVDDQPKLNRPQKKFTNIKYKRPNEGNHPCPFCSEKRFVSERSLQLHLRTHPGVKYSSKKAQICDVCTKPFMCPSALKTHLRTHTGEKPFLCESCGRGFADIRNLKRHVISCSRPPKPPKPYVENIEAKLLLEKQKPPVEHPHVCNLCGKTFAHFTEHTSHMRIHTEITPYSCRLCGNFFQNPVTLQSHILEYHMENNDLFL